MKYKVVGNHSVNGAAPGSVLSADQLEGCNIGLLVEAGHLKIVQSKAVKAAASAEADEAEQEET